MYEKPDPRLVQEIGAVFITSVMVVCVGGDCYFTEQKTKIWANFDLKTRILTIYLT